MVCKAWSRRIRDRRDCNNLMVYGWAGLWRRPSPGARSTMRPAYMIATQSATSATMPRSCVMSKIAVPVCVWRVFINVRISACTVTSTAVVGSSAISSPGSQARAMAIITRCFMPPDNWCGYAAKRCSGSGIYTWASRSSALARCGLGQTLVVAQRLHKLISDRKHRIERSHRLLKDHSDLGHAVGVSRTLAAA